MSSISGINQISQGSLPLPPLPPQQQLPGGILPPIPMPMPGSAAAPPAMPQTAQMQPPAPYDQSKDPNVIAAQRAADATRAAQSDIDARYKPQEDKLYSDVDKDQDALSALKAKGPDQVPLPENTARHIDPQQMTEAFSAFSALGALAGLLSKAPMTAALNNMTAAIKGVQEGDDAQYQRSYKEFQDNYKKAMDTNKARLDEYNRIFSDTKMTLDEKMREIGLVAAKHGDELTRAEIANQTPKGVLDAIKAGQKATDNAQKQYDAWAAKNQEHEDKLQFHADSMQEHADRMKHEDATLAESIRYHNAEIQKMVGGGKGMTPTMKHTVNLDISELDQALNKLDSLKTQTGSPFFNASKPGIINGLLGKSATPEDMQVYDVYANRIATAIAGVQSMGRGLVSDSKINEARKLVPILGDKPATIEAKKSQIRAIIQMAQKEMATEPGGDGTMPTTSPTGKTIVKTGMQGNRKVVQYSDGTIDYAN